MSRRVVRVGRARNRDPIGGARRADDAARRRISARDAERHRRRVHVVRARRVLDAAKVALHSHANSVVRVRELKTAGAVVVEAEDLAAHARKELQTAVRGFVDRRALDLSDFNAETSRE